MKKKNHFIYGLGKWSMHEVTNNTFLRTEGKFLTYKPGKYFFHLFNHMTMSETVFVLIEIDTLLA